MLFIIIVYVCVGVQACYSAHVEVKGQRGGVSLFLLPHGSQDLVSGAFTTGLSMGSTG